MERAALTPPLPCAGCPRNDGRGVSTEARGRRV